MSFSACERASMLAVASVPRPKPAPKAAAITAVMPAPVPAKAAGPGDAAPPALNSLIAFWSRPMPHIVMSAPVKPRLIAAFSIDTASAFEMAAPAKLETCRPR